MFTVRRERSTERGVSAVEYAIIAAGMAIAIIAVVATVGGNLSTVIGGVVPSPSSSSSASTPDDPGTISVPVTQPWLPPSWVDTMTPAPTSSDPSGGSALSGGSPGITQQRGWTYGTVGGPPAWGASAVQVTGTQADGFTFVYVADCLMGGWGEGDGQLGCQLSDFVGHLVDTTNPWDDDKPLVTCTNHTNDSYRFSVAAGYLQNYNSICGGDDYVRSVKFRGRVSGASSIWSNAVIQESLWTNHPTLTTSLVCRSNSTGAETTVSDTAEGYAPTVVCPAGSTPVRVTVVGDDTVLDAQVDPDHVSDWQQAWNFYDGMHLKQNPSTGWCQLTNGSGFSVNLPFSDCDSFNSR